MSDNRRLLANCYELETKIGHGGTSDVYKAYDREAGNAVRAIKEISKADRDVYAMAKEEAMRIKELSESDKSNDFFPNIIRIFETEHFFYIVEDLIDGESMEAMLGEGPMPDKIFIEAAKQICSCMSFLHDKGIVHSDMKPENIMVVKKNNALMNDGSTIKLKFIDFGTMVRGSTDVIGYTPEYAAPEQFDHGHIDNRTDIFNIGATFYHMIQGKKPLKVNKDSEMRSSAERFVFSRRVDSSIKRIIMKCVAEDPANRYQSCDELYKDLRRAEKKTSQHIFAAVLGLSVACLAGSAILSFAAGRENERIIDDRYRAYVNMENFEDAIRLKPENIDGIYLKLIESYKQDSRLDAGENAFIMDNIKARHPISEKDSDYGECMYQIGNAYFLYYYPFDESYTEATDQELLSDRINTSYSWLDAALKSGQLGDEHYRRANIFYGICEFYVNIDRMETEGSDTPEMYSGMWENLESFSVFIDETNDMESVRVCQTLLHLISRYCGKFSRNGVTREQQEAVIDKIRNRVVSGSEIVYTNDIARSIAGSFNYDTVKKKIRGAYEDKKGDSYGTADIV